MVLETIGMLGTRKSARNFRSGKESQERGLRGVLFDRGEIEVFTSRPRGQLGAIPGVKTSPSGLGG